jgi:Tol biopolymer transport system component
VHSIALALLALCARASAQAGLSFADMSTGGVQLGASDSAAISSNGRWVAFTTAAAAEALDTNGVNDVYLRDTYTNETRLVSRNGGVVGNGASSTSYVNGVSRDGRWVLLTSYATNLLGVADTNGDADLFLHDMITHTNARVNVGNAGQQANAPTGLFGWPGRAALSADGRFVAFGCRSANLVAGGDTNNASDVFRWDRTTGVSTLVSASTGGGIGNGVSGDASISADGRWVVFSSDASNLVAGDTNGVFDVFRRDMSSGTTTRVSLGSPGNFQAPIWPSGGASISFTGRFVVFGSNEQLTPQFHGWTAVYLRDMVLGVTTLISPDYADGNCYWETISADGTKIAFTTDATNIDLLHHPGAVDTYLHDVGTATTIRISTGPSGDGSTGSGTTGADQVLNDDGTVLAFACDGDNLIAGDSVPGGDVFVWRSGPQPMLPFCFGDSGGTACPCANNSPAGAQEGCLSSIGDGGRLRWSGTTSLANDTVVLQGSQMPIGSSALYFQGTSGAGGGFGTVFGDGLRCASGSTVRLITTTNLAGASLFPSAGDPSVSVRGGVSVPGTRTYQVWYRNAAAFCTVSSFNLTNGLIAVWTP